MLYLYRHIKEPFQWNSAWRLSVSVNREVNVSPQRHQEHPASFSTASVSSQTQPQVSTRIHTQDIHFTSRQRSCGKVTFSVVYLSAYKGFKTLPMAYSTRTSLCRDPPNMFKLVHCEVLLLVSRCLAFDWYAFLLQLQSPVNTRRNATSPVTFATEI